MIRKIWQALTWWRYEWVEIPLPLEDRIMAFYILDNLRVYGDLTGWRRDFTPTEPGQ